MISIYVFSFLFFQGKFVRINFDASGFIAGANIGKEKNLPDKYYYFYLNLCFLEPKMFIALEK